MLTQSSYVDKYISTVPGSPAFVGNRSIVVHYNNKTIITCANFAQNGQFSSGTPGGGGVSAATAVVPFASSVMGGAPGPIVSVVTVSGAVQTVTITSPAGPAGMAPHGPVVSTVTMSGAAQTVTITSFQGQNGV